MKQKQEWFIALTMQHNSRNKWAACCLIISIFCSAQALAFSEQEMSDEQKDALMGDWKPLEVTGDAIPWDVFAKTTETEECTTDKEGFDYCIVKPGYSADIKKEDGKQVTLMGFMFPLEQSEEQKNFLIGPFPLSCPFHYHVGPAQIVEVLAKKPVEFSYEPVTLKGKLSLRFNEETGVFYYLEDATLE